MLLLEVTSVFSRHCGCDCYNHYDMRMKLFFIILCHTFWNQFSNWGLLFFPVSCSQQLCTHDPVRVVTPASRDEKSGEYKKWCLWGRWVI